MVGRKRLSKDDKQVLRGERRNDYRRASTWVHAKEAKPFLTSPFPGTYSLQSVSVYLILKLAQQRGDYSHFVVRKQGPEK